MSVTCMPVPRAEYLAIDVTAFAGSASKWPLPTAVIELENSRRDDLVAYSLWKVLAVRAELRVVFCYRSDAEQGSALVQQIQRDVIAPLGPDERLQLGGETLLVVGQRDDASAFPHGFFRPWILESNTGHFVRC